MAKVHRCNFCEGEMKKYEPSNPFCRRKKCFDMRMRHASELADLIHGPTISAVSSGGYTRMIREEEKGTRKDKAR